MHGCYRIRGLAPPAELTHLKTIGSSSSPPAAALEPAPAWQACIWRMVCHRPNTPGRTCSSGCSGGPRMLAALWPERLQVCLWLPLSRDSLGYVLAACHFPSNVSSSSERKGDLELAVRRRGGV